VPPREEAVVVVVVVAEEATAVRRVQLLEAAPGRYGLPAFVDRAHPGGAFQAPRQVEPMARAMAESVPVALSFARMAPELHREHFRPEVSSVAVCHRERPAPAALLAGLFVLQAAELHRAHSFPPAALLPVACSSAQPEALRPARFVQAAPVSFAAPLLAVPALHSPPRAADDFPTGRFLRPRAAAAAALAPPA
jgi:hypothetical protein